MNIKNKIKMKQIKYYWLSLLFSVGCLNSCDIDRLDTPSLSPTEADYFTQKPEFELVLFNAYAKMTDWYWFRAQNFLQPIYFLQGDDITEDLAFNTWEVFNNINSTNGDITYFFSQTYQMIQRANVVIDKVDKANAADFPDASFLPIVKGEALFLRALANFKLYNMFGTAPVVTSRLTSETINQPRSEGTQLLDQVILDCQEAATLLPATWPAASAGRATKNSANGLLLKALVFRGDYNGTIADYTAAVQAYNQITATLTINYTDNFKAATENNSESLFEFQASRQTAVDNVWLQNDGPWRGVECMSTYWGFYTVISNGQRQQLRGNNWKLTQKMVNAYGTDPRVDYYTEANRNITKYGKEGEDEGSGTAGSLNNNRMLRFAESKLLAAEALLLSAGSKATAIGLINDVRTRARAWALTAGVGDGTVPANRSTAETDTNTIMTWIEDERAMELMGEEMCRWYDLKRWDARGYKDLSTWGGGITHFNTDVAGTFQFEYPKHLLLPIPQDEINRNSAINENNPGY
jgi:starch-binding outer membrane protein, SusD/RagB family